MNKGITIATGEIVGILNSDDFFIDNTVLQSVANGFTEQNVDACYGDIIYCDRNKVEKKKRYWKAGLYNEKKINYGWMPPHPAFFVRKEIYNRFGLFNLSFKIAADYEFIVRLFKREKINAKYIEKTLVVMREGGDSSKNIFQRLKGFLEIKRAWIVNGFRPSPFLIIIRVLSKIQQIFI
jgi:glycosyltransferase